MRDTEKFKRKALISNDPKDWANCEEFRNQVNNKIKIAKKRHIIRMLFRIIRAVFGRPGKTSTIFHLEIPTI